MLFLKIQWLGLLFFCLASFSACRVDKPEIGKTHSGVTLKKCEEGCGLNEICGTNGYCKSLSGANGTHNGTTTSTAPGGNNPGHVDSDDMLCFTSATYGTSDDPSDTCTGAPPPCGDQGICALCFQKCIGESFQPCTLDNIPGYQTSENNCRDDLDNDCDGLIDCKDENCASDWRCQYPGCLIPEGMDSVFQQGKETLCEDTLDNDCDGKIDCEDSDCAGTPECTCGADDPEYEGTKELTCDDHKDNDCDGLIDCDDPDCVLSPACEDPTCKDESCCQFIGDKSKIVLDKSGNKYHGKNIDGEIVPAGKYGQSGVRPKRTGGGRDAYAVEIYDCNRISEKFANGFTIEMWVYLDFDNSGIDEFWLTTKGSSFTFLLDEGGNGPGYSNLELRVARATPATPRDSVPGPREIFYFEDQLVPTKQWVHLAVTYNAPAGKATFYINGQVAAADQHHDASGSLVVTEESNVKLGNFAGVMDEFKLYKGVKTQAEIQQSMVNAGVLLPDLLVYFDFEE